MHLNGEIYSQGNNFRLVYLKFIYFEKATKILRNLPLTFDYSTYGQKLGEDLAKFCGLLRIYELYHIRKKMWELFGIYLLTK